MCSCFNQNTFLKKNSINFFKGFDGRRAVMTQASIEEFCEIVGIHIGYFRGK